MTDTYRPQGLDPAVATWYAGREDVLVQSAINQIRTLQFKMPDHVGPYRPGPWPTDWWSVFWETLEREGVVEQRRLFVRMWKEENASGGYQKSLDEVFSVDHERHEYIVAGQQDLEAFADGGVVGE
jgi:hypothetical protein